MATAAPVSRVAQTRCPCALVVNDLLAQFEPAVADRLQYLASLTTSDPIVFESDTPLDRVFHAFAAYCPFCTQRILGELLGWRNTRHVRLLSDTAADKQHLAVDIVFIEACIAALSQYEGDTVPEEFAVAVENAAHEYCRMQASLVAKSDTAARPIFSQLFSNSAPASLTSSLHNYLFDLWSLALGRISVYRVAQIASRFLQSTEHDDINAVHAYRMLRSVDLRLDSEPVLNQTMQFVQLLFRMFSSCSRRPNVKRAIVETMTCVMYPVAMHPTQASINLTDWYNLMQQIYVSVRRWARKPRRRAFAYPLLTVVLCNCEPEHFITNFGVLLESLIALYDERETRLIGIACIQRLFHVYLEQIAYRKNATSNNLLTIVRRIVFGDHKRLPYVDGTHQMEHDGLVALILTVAEGKFDFCVSEVIVRMLQSAEGEDVINEYVQLALRALIAIFDRGERRTRLFTSACALNESLPPGFRTHYGPSISNMLEAIAERLCTLQPFQSADLGPYIHQLGTLLGTILKHCYRAVGQTLLTTPTQSTPKSPATCAAIGSPAVDPKTEAVHLPTLVYRFGLAALPYIWTESVQESDLLRWVIQASIHQNGGIRVAAGYVIDSIESNPRDRNMIGRFLGRLAEYIISGVPLSYDQVALHLLENLCRILSSLPDRPDRLNTIISDSQADQIEAASLFWLSSTNPLIRLICFRILEAIRRTINSYNEDAASDDDDDVVAQMETSTVGSPSMTSSPRRRRARRVCVLNVIEMSEPVIVASYDRHTLPDLLQACAFSKEREEQPSDEVDRHVLTALCNRTSAIRVIHAATCKDSEKAQNRWTTFLAAIIRRLVNARHNHSLKLLFSEAAVQVNTFLTDRDLKLPKSAYFQYRNIGVAALAAAGASTEYPHMQLADSVVSRCVSCLRSHNDDPHVIVSMTALGNVSPALVEAVLSALPTQSHLARVTYVYRLIAEGLTSNVLHDYDSVRSRFVAYVQKICVQFDHDSVVDTELKQSFAIIIRRLCEESVAEPCSKELDQLLRVQLFSLLSRWVSPSTLTSSRRGSRVDSTGAESVSILTAMAALLLGPFLDLSGQIPDSQVFPWINSVLRNPKPSVRDIGSLALQNVLVSNPNSMILSYFANQCYAAEVPVARRYFLVIGEHWMNTNNARLSLTEIIHLIIYKLGDKSFTVRSMAMDMVPVLAEKRPGALYGRNVPHMVITSRLPDTYLQTQLEVSLRFSKEYASITDEFLSTLWKYLPTVPPYDQLIMLRYCQCWIQGINLTGKLGSRMLEILFRVTVEHGVHFAVELQQIWRELAATGPNDTRSSDNLRCTLKFLLVKCCLCEIERSSRHVDVIFETAKRITLYLSRVAQTDVIQLLISEIEQESESVFGALPESDEDKHAQTMSDIDVILKNLDRSQSEGLLAAPGLYPPSEAGDQIKPHRHPSSRISGSDQTNPSTSHIALMLLVEVAYEMKSDALTQFQSHVMLMQHWALLGLDHHVFEIREHCKFLLLNMVHALTFRGFDSDAFADDNDQEEHRAQVSRRNKARQLMDFLMTGDGVPLWKREIVTNTTMVLDSVDAMAAVIRPLLQVCDVPNAMESWSQYALECARRGGPLIASRSLQIFRILTENCTVDAIPTIVKQMVEFLHVSKDPSVISEALSTLVVILDRITDGNGPLLDLLSHLLWHCVDVLGSNNVPVHLFIHAVTLLIQLLDKISVEDQAVRIAIMRQRLSPFQGLQPLVLDGLAAGCIVRQPAYILLSKLTLSGFSAFIDPSDGRILHNIIGLLPWLCEHGTMREYPSAVSNAARNLRRLSETRLDDIKLSRGLAAFERHEFRSISQFCMALAPSLTSMMKKHGDDVVFTILTGMLRSGTADQQRVIIAILTALFTHLNWQHTSLRHHGYHLFSTLIEMQNGVHRTEIMALISIVLEKTCSVSGSLCSDWSQDVIHPATPVIDVAAIPAPKPRSPTPVRPRSPSPKRDTSVHTAVPSTHSPNLSTDDEDEKDARQMTWSAEWARRRRMIYSTHSRRLSFISNQFRDEQTARSPRRTTTRAPTMPYPNPISPSAPPGEPPSGTLSRTPSKLYPALYRQHSSDSGSMAGETRRFGDGWGSPVPSRMEGFGFLRRRSSTHLPSAPSIEKDFGSWEYRMTSPASVKSDGGTIRNRMLGRPPRTPPIPTGQRPFRMTPDDATARRHYY